MKKGWFKLALCVGVCAVLGAVSLAGGCSIISSLLGGSSSGGNSTSGASFDEREVTEDDIATFKTAMDNMLSYTGSYTITITGSETYTEDGETEVSDNYAYISYDATSGRIYEIETGYGEYAVSIFIEKNGNSYTAYLSDEDGVKTYSAYPEGSYNLITKEVQYIFTEIAYEFDYDSNSLTADVIENIIFGMATGYYAEDLEEYTTSFSVKGENGATVFMVTAENTEYGETLNGSFTIKDGKITEIAGTEEESDGDSSSYIYAYSYSFAFTYDSSNWPSSFEGYTEATEDDYYWY